MGIVYQLARNPCGLPQLTELLARTTEVVVFGRGYWRGRGSSAHNQNKHLGEPLGARLF